MSDYQQRFIQPFSRDDGDKWLELSVIYSQPSIIIQYESSLIPQTWEFVGSAFQVIQVPDIGFCLNQEVRIRPLKPQLIRWRDVSQQYLIWLRLVPYVREGSLMIWELQP